MEVHCHRGCPGPEPENSLPAVRQVPAHVDAIEIDVQQCASGEPVVFHDRTLDRTTDASGTIAGASLETVSRTTLEGTAATVPTLEAVVETVSPETGLTVELKHAGVFDAVAPILERAENPVQLSSFVPQALLQFAWAGFDTALLIDPRAESGWEGVLDAAISLDADALHAHYAGLNDDRVTEAHDRGLDVVAWTVPDEENVRQCRRDGVDGVIVDDWRIVPDDP